MHTLYTLGYHKAVILQVIHFSPAELIVIFTVPEPGSLEDRTKPRPLPAWPRPLSVNVSGPLFDTDWTDTSASLACKLDLGAGLGQLEELFNSSLGILHTNVEDPGLDSELHAFLSALPLLHDHVPDRYVIYVDGSSQGPQQHRPIEWVESQGISDAWAFIVTAECYATSRSPTQLYLVGWTAQQVRYTEQSPNFLGADHTGSLTAERGPCCGGPAPIIESPATSRQLAQ